MTPASALVAGVLLATAAGEDAPLEIERATAAIHVDGVLDENDWQRALKLPLRYEHAPGDNIPPPVATTCLLLLGQTQIYFACQAHDPDPRRIRAQLSDRDSEATFSHDDHVGFLFDTFGDRRRAYELRVNPLGVQADAVVSEIDDTSDASFDLIWDSAGRITGDGYTVEAAIPLQQLRFPPEGAWGVEAFRAWPRDVLHRASSRAHDRDAICNLCQLDRMTGFAGITPGRSVEIDPTLALHRSDRRASPTGPLEHGSLEADLGVSGRWLATPGVVVAGAANPDFSQVEADSAQLEVNTRFALFYPEKRPFFLEGSDYFGTPLQAVFTRTVADPSLGFRVTGKEGANAFGAFVARDDLNNLLLPSNQFSDQASLDHPVTGAALRLRRDVGDGSTVGILYTGRAGGDYHNHVLGPDAYLRFGASDSLRVQALFSATRYDDDFARATAQPERGFGGNALRVYYEHETADWQGFARYEDLTSGFRADSGFIPRVDLRTAEALLNREWRTDSGRWYTQCDLGLRLLSTHDHRGRETDREIEGYFEWNGPMQSFVNLSLARNRYRFDEREYPLTHGRFWGWATPLPGLRVEARIEGGDAIDFDNQRPARDLELAPAVAWRLGRHVSLELEHTRRRLAIDSGRVFLADLTQARALYHFNIRSFVRAIVQYTALTRDTRLFLEPVPTRSRELFTQLLFSYKLNPQAALLVGYSDGRENLVDDGLDLTGRTFFAKVSYAWFL